MIGAMPHQGFAQKIISPFIHPGFKPSSSDLFQIRAPKKDSEQGMKLSPKVISLIADGMRIKLDDAEIFSCTFAHSGIDINGKKIPIYFDASEESEGTQKYFALAGPLLNVLDFGSCLVVDELDVKLHPLLTKSIIEMFQNEKSNPNNAQLICALHDIFLMSSKKLLRRDQIWFVHREEDGGSQLYSAWDYKIRKNESLQKNYLAGSYGAVPFIEELL
jgi:uncharacterized protein